MNRRSGPEAVGQAYGPTKIVFHYNHSRNGYEMGLECGMNCLQAR